MKQKGQCVAQSRCVRYAPPLQTCFLPHFVSYSVQQLVAHSGQDVAQALSPIRDDRRCNGNTIVHSSEKDTSIVHDKDRNWA
jgi:hypothetical protein